MTSSLTLKPVVFSAIQPSGPLTLGHYIGAIRHWITLHTTHDGFFSIVDLHAITAPYKPQQLTARCYEILALYLACGLDPQQSTLFIQSHVPAHSQLAWILSCITPMGELKRMTQFKDKSQRHPQATNAALLNYPLLMAADILLYQTQLVPVGHDQKQHLELARRLALRINQQYAQPILTVPEPYIAPVGARIMSLQDPKRKMSKSDPVAGNYIALLDDPQTIRRKIQRAVTDSEHTIAYNPDNRPGVSNLLTLFSAITQHPITQLEQDYKHRGYSALKNDLADTIIALITPLQERYHGFRNDQPLLEDILKRGAQKARSRAADCLKRIHQVLGLPACH